MTFQKILDSHEPTQCVFFQVSSNDVAPGRLQLCLSMALKLTPSLLAYPLFPLFAPLLFAPSVFMLPLIVSTVCVCASSYHIITVCTSTIRTSTICTSIVYPTMYYSCSNLHHCSSCYLNLQYWHLHCSHILLLCTPSLPVRFPLPSIIKPSPMHCHRSKFPSF